MRSVPIPGEILRTDVFMGLTFDELVILSSVPIVVVFPTLYIREIPIVATLSVIGLVSLAVVGVVIRTPEGQTPLEWAPAAIKRRITPDTYYLKPKEPERDQIAYLDVVQIASQVDAGGTDSERSSLASREGPISDATLTRDVRTDRDFSEPRSVRPATADDGSDDADEGEKESRDEIAA